MPFISICIPAYKRVGYLERLFQSIIIQSYKDYEVVVTDDSPDDQVLVVCRKYMALIPIRYHKNPVALGTPANWNEAITLAQGTWIKLMHDDDWFADKNALYRFFHETQKRPNCSFFFSSFCNVVEPGGARQVVKCSIIDLLFLRLTPLHLFKKVYVGNPSCTLIKKDINLLYDDQFKFVVDFEFYIRCFKQIRKYHYIDETLLNIGFHDEQVTKYTFMVREVQIPENIELLKKLGTGILKNVIVYDYYWRLMRNLNITQKAEIEKYYNGIIPQEILNMINYQVKIGRQRLKKGIISKFFMGINYIKFVLKV